MTGCQLKATQFVAMFMKRFLNTKRDKKAVITQLIIPILLIILGLILSENVDSSWMNQQDDPALTLQLSKLLGKKNQDSIHGYYADTRTSVSANEKTRMKDVGVLYFQKHSIYEGFCYMIFLALFCQFHRSDVGVVRKERRRTELFIYF